MRVLEVLNKYYRIFDLTTVELLPYLYQFENVLSLAIIILAIHVLPCYTASCKSPSQFRVLKAFTLPLMVLLSGNLGLQEEEDLLMLAENILMNIESHLASCVDSIDIVSMLKGFNCLICHYLYHFINTPF